MSMTSGTRAASALLVGLALFSSCVTPHLVPANLPEPTPATSVAPAIAPAPEPPPVVTAPMSGEPGEADVARARLVPETCESNEQAIREVVNRRVERMREAVAAATRGWI